MSVRPEGPGSGDEEEGTDLRCLLASEPKNWWVFTLSNQGMSSAVYREGEARAEAGLRSKTRLFSTCKM